MVLTIWPNRLADIRCFERSILERRNLATVVSLQRANPRKMVLCHAFADKHQIPFLRHSKPYEMVPMEEENEKRRKVGEMKKGSKFFFRLLKRFDFSILLKTSKANRRRRDWGYGRGPY